MSVALPRRITASEVAQLLRAPLHGEDRAVLALASLGSAGPDDLAFHDRGDPGNAGVLLTRTPIANRICIVAVDPLVAMCSLITSQIPERSFAATHPSTSGVASTALVHPGVVIGAHCTVGAGTILFPNVVLYPGTRIGERCRIHAGAVIGADGFRYCPTATGPLKVPHVAGVHIGDDVEIGANSTIDRGFLDDTTIGSGSKLDDQVHVGHNCRIGQFVVIAAQTGISGSCTIGDGAQIGGQVGIADHAEIGAGARIGAQSGVHGVIPAGETWLGTPALPIATMRRVYAITKDLPQMWRKLRG